MNLYAISRADELIDLKKKSGSSFWPVIDRIFEIFKETNPTRYASYILEVERIRKSRRDPKFGRSKTKDAPLRYTLDIPEFVIKSIRALYSVEELPMDREFFLRFAKRYKQYKIAEKL